jgi:uncharacterized protein (TIGR03067 family)
MYRARRFTFHLATLLIVLAGIGADKAVDNTLAALQGRWKVVSSSREFDNSAAFYPLVGTTIVIANDKMKIKGPRDGPVEKMIVLGPAGDPRQIDLNQDEHAKGWWRSGIFRLHGDSLTLAVTFVQRKRPTTFSSADDETEVVELTRVAEEGR